ncbi:MAG: response regulator [Nitrospirae bacterium]|nr:response regulator [Nitrospirota bacterium]MCL5285136.1 response regulator [Nitrospirota bacterium]
MADPKFRILVVDDERSSRRLLEALLQAESYAVETAESARDALDILEQSPVPDAILTDGMMPGMTGFDFAARLKADKRTRSIPVIIVTAIDDREVRLRALESGVEDFLLKPVDRAELKVRLRNILRLKEQGERIRRNNEILEDTVRHRTAQLHESYLETIRTLIRAAEKKDEETGAHIQRISHYCKEMAEKLGMPDDFVRTIFVSSPMHDVGKIGISDRILLKNGPLSADEWNIMRTHTTLGANIIGKDNPSPELRMGRDIALGHHERWDGSGYPRGLQGEDIPLCARIMALADVYDALRSRRPYKEPFDHQTAIEIIQKGDARVRPEHFDPALLSLFPRAAPAFAEYFDSLSTGSGA